MMLATNLIEAQRRHLLRWAGAALFVVAAHVGCTALALMNWTNDDAEDAAASSVVVEMVPAPAATPIDSMDVAHGPLMEEATSTPQATKETKQEVEKEMPTVEPSPAPDPEVVLPTPHPVTEKPPDEEKPQEDTPKQRSAEQATAVPLTMAPPRVEAKEQRAAPAPSPGAAAAAARAQETWRKSLSSHLNRFKRYPDAARARNNEGEVTVEFTIDRTGGLVASRIVKSSGSSTLDAEALELLQRASPFPQLPAQVPGEIYNLALPVQFHMK
jgi:periplasmic protein TonB